MSHPIVIIRHEILKRWCKSFVSDSFEEKLQSRLLGRGKELDGKQNAAPGLMCLFSSPKRFKMQVRDPQSIFYINRRVETATMLAGGQRCRSIMISADLTILHALTHIHNDFQRIEEPASTGIPSNTRLYPPPGQKVLLDHRKRRAHRNRLLHHPHPLCESMDSPSRPCSPSLDPRRPTSRRPEYLEPPQSSRAILGC